jgi:nitronate monooxygenase
VATGGAVLAAQALGADLAYVGTAFIATDEARAVPAYKQMLLDSTSDDIVYSKYFTGVHGNYLRGSVIASGIDPDTLDDRDATVMDFSKVAKDASVKAWKDIWGAGQGIAALKQVVPAGQLVARLSAEYTAARARLAALPG